MRCLQGAQELVLSFLPSTSCLALLLVDWSSSLLSKSLQEKRMSAVEGQHLAEMTIQALQALCTDKKFSDFWKEILAKQNSLGVDEPQLPCRRKVPARLQEGNSSPVFHTALTDYFCPIYFQALDTIIFSIKERFNYKQYSQLEGLLLKGVRGVSCVEEMEAVKILYGDEISISTLDAQISLLRAHFSTSEEVTVSIAEIVAYVNSLETKHVYVRSRRSYSAHPSFSCHQCHKREIVFSAASSEDIVEVYNDTTAPQSLRTSACFEGGVR